MYRILIGLASGFVLVTVPLHLSEIAPKRFNRLFGTLHQISIGLGMMVAQSLSLILAKSFEWRYILLIGEGIALSLLVIGFFVAQPKARNAEGREEERRLLPVPDGQLIHTSDLRPSSRSDSEEETEPLSVRQVLTTDNEVVRKARESTPEC